MYRILLNKCRGKSLNFELNAGSRINAGGVYSRVYDIPGEEQKHYIYYLIFLLASPLNFYF